MDREALQSRLTELRQAENEAHEVVQRVTGARMEVERMLADLQEPTELKLLDQAANK